MKIKNHLKKPIVIGAVILIVSMLSVVGALMNYYVNVTINVDSGVALEWSDDDVTYENAEDLAKTLDFNNMVANDTATFTRYMRYSANADHPVVVWYKISDQSTDDPEGITIALQYDNGGTWTDVFNWSASALGDTSGQYTFNPSDAETFRFWVYMDEYLKEGDHQFLLEVENFAKFTP